MKIIVLIPTIGRKALLSRTLAHLEKQSRKPDEIIVSAPDETHVDRYNGSVLSVNYVFGRKGASAQRNVALEVAKDRCDIISFFDDDFLPATTYIERLLCAFQENDDWAVINGNLVEDGINSSGLTFEQGLAALAAAEAGPARPLCITEHPGAYGCNMSFRSRDIGTLRFDERLVLYGWQEDIDFTSQLLKYGRIVNISTLLGVHLGIKSGRVSGVRLGYSQLVNPIYLIQKGTVSIPFAFNLMSRNVGSNVVRSFYPEPWVDRRGRLRGNLIAAWHLLGGHIEPEYVLKL
jgi:glycosyltransferase involved in cell wall biosynthesis